VTILDQSAAFLFVLADYNSARPLGTFLLSEAVSV
jgi:hypothetical protein